MFCKFDGKVFQQISATAIGTKFALPYACIFMDKVETDFLDKENVKPWLWPRYRVWTEGRDSLDAFLQRLNDFLSNLNYTYEYSSKPVNFLYMLKLV